MLKRLKLSIPIIMALLMLSGCIEAGENLKDKAAEVDDNYQNSITSQLKNVALDVVENNEINDTSLIDVINLITSPSHDTKPSLDDLKILTKPFKSPSSNSIQTGEVIYKAKYLTNYDGDTMTFLIDSAYERIDDNTLKEIKISQTALAGNAHKVTVRALLVDAPEIVNKKTGKADEYALESKQFTQKQLESASTIWLQHDLGDKQDKYSRELMHIWVDQDLLSVRLLKAGLAKIAYIHEPNTTYLEEYKQAEMKAKEKGEGIWSNK
ncbi:thermonuclease family protein [Lysinibacillus sp. NPDC056232]|uniref:thermonuclease family protein n=1 Tax=Lysinibacillus sp. NPDC056232 TaxID=3345756 RepID=UPI0035D7A584